MPVVKSLLASLLAALVGVSGCSQCKPSDSATPKPHRAEPTTETAPEADKTPSKEAASQASSSRDLLPVPPGGARINTPYSRIVIRERGTVRTLYFVRDSGVQVVESEMDVANPHKLQLNYTQLMFASYFFMTEPKNVLIVGIGAGSMIRFLQHFEPEVKIDAVDIDPEIIEIAGGYFGTRENRNTRLIADDGVKFIRNTQTVYDIIYMDAFLKPSDATDSTGVPLTMKTIAFYQQIREKLTKNGMVVFNLNMHQDVSRDIDNIRRAFPSGHLFMDKGRGQYVMVATNAPTQAVERDLKNQAPRLEKRFDGVLPFTAFADQLME